MSSTVIIVLAVVGGLILLALAGLAVSRLRKSRERRRARMSSDAAGHRQEAEAHVARAQDLAPKVEVLREEAHQESALADKHADLARGHAARADDLGEQAGDIEQRATREGQSAGRHDDQATELEDKL